MTKFILSTETWTRACHTKNNSTQVSKRRRGRGGEGDFCRNLILRASHRTLDDSKRKKKERESQRESEIGISTYSLYCSTVKTKGSLSKSFLSHHLFHKSFSSLRSLGLEGKGGGKYTGASDISSYCRAFDRRGSMDRGGLTEQPRDSCPRPPLRRRRRRRGRRAL